jgi:hypothetical protein
MDSDNRNARIAGLSFLISYLGLILGNLIMGPILEGSGFLANVYPNRVLLGIGILLESVNGIAVIGIAVMLYPILKRQNEGVALGYLIFRVVEALLSIVGSTMTASLIEISHAYLDAGSPGDSYFETLATLVLANKHWAMEMLTVFFLLGAFIFYLLLYQGDFLPKYVAIWGMIAVILVATFNGIFYTGIDLGMAVNLILVLPIIANEFFVAIWLIVRGINTTQINN